MLLVFVLRLSFGQKEKDEKVIVDDGSTDRSAEIVRNFCSPLIKLVTQPNGGGCRARNLAMQGRGGINIIDLANLKSCAFLQTQDMGSLQPDGSFEILGRIEGNEIRGCNLLVQ